MKILLISHTCQSRTEGQPRPQALGALPDIDLLLLTPDRWKHYGRWRRAQKPLDPTFDTMIARVALPWLGPAQNYLHFYPALGRVLRRFAPDLIDVWEEPWSAVAAQTCWLRDRVLPRAKIVIETEQNLNKTLPPPFETLRAYSLRHADAVVCRNSEATEVVRSKGFNGPLHVVPNCVDADLFRPLNREKCRAELHLNGFVAGYVGRMIEDKGVMDLIEALPLCDERVQVLAVGSGAAQDAFEARAKQLKVEHRVRFLGAQPVAALPKIMNAIDVLALPSRTTPSWKEQFGRVIIEAHACATPVIGSDSGAIPDVIGEAGIVVPERDSKALATALQSLADDPERTRQMGEIGRRVVEERYTWARVAEQMREIYRDLV